MTDKLTMLNIPFTCISDRLYIAHRTNRESGDHYNQTHQISVVTTIKFPLPPQWLVTTNPTLSQFYSVLSVFLGTVYRKAVRRFHIRHRDCRCDVHNTSNAGQTSNSTPPPSTLCGDPTVQLRRRQLSARHF